MGNGGWDENGETLKYDSKGVLVDGQHRLAACVKANKPFRTLVAYGVDDLVDIDSGMRRSAGQLLAKVDGTKNTSIVIAALRILDRWERGVLHVSRGGSQSLTNKELLARYDANNRVADSVNRYLSARHVARLGSIAAMHYICATEVSAPLADAYFDQIAFGGGVRQSPASVARERMMSLKARKLQLDAVSEIVAMLRGLKAFAQGRAITRVWTAPKGGKAWTKENWPGFPSQEDAERWESNQFWMAK
jgi:hypothetical protein